MTLLKDLLSLNDDQQSEPIHEARRSRDLSELIEKWCDENGAHSFEGARGEQHLSKLIRVMGGYSSMSEFLSDNPGVIEAILMWLGDQRNSEWLSNMEDAVSGDDDDEDEDR